MSNNVLNFIYDSLFYSMIDGMIVLGSIFIIRNYFHTVGFSIFLKYCLGWSIGIAVLSFEPFGIAQVLMMIWTLLYACIIFKKDFMRVILITICVYGMFFAIEVSLARLYEFIVFKDVMILSLDNFYRFLFFMIVKIVESILVYILFLVCKNVRLHHKT